MHPRIELELIVRGTNKEFFHQGQSIEALDGTTKRSLSLTIAGAVAMFTPIRTRPHFSMSYASSVHPKAIKKKHKHNHHIMEKILIQDLHFFQQKKVEHKEFNRYGALT